MGLREFLLLTDGKGVSLPNTNGITEKSEGYRFLLTCDPWRIPTTFKNGDSTHDFLIQQKFTILGQENMYYLTSPEMNEQGITDWVRDIDEPSLIYVKDGWKSKFTIFYDGNEKTWVLPIEKEPTT